uniref:Uncharacterized protein n=1 Tax=Brassica oleracea var. oleracea TaxID=109376 RepID=A0A0D3ASZ6_BRAOL
MKNIKFKEFRQQFRHDGRLLLYGDDELLITDMPKEEVKRYHLSLEDLFPSCFGETNYERLKLYPSLLIISDKGLPSKKSLYIRLGCRGDWPNIQPLGWDPSSDTGAHPSFS